jgi:hypothetical protein
VAASVGGSCEAGLYHMDFLRPGWKFAVEAESRQALSSNSSGLGFLRMYVQPHQHYSRRNGGRKEWVQNSFRVTFYQRSAMENIVDG